MIIKRTLLPVLITLSSFLFSCDSPEFAKVEESLDKANHIPAFLELYNFSNTKTSGSIELSSFKTASSSEENGEGAYYLDARFLGSDGKSVDYGNLYIGDVLMNSNSSIGYKYSPEGMSMAGENAQADYFLQKPKNKSLFGKNIKIRLEGNGISQRSTEVQSSIEEEIYIPKDVYVSSPKVSAVGPTPLKIGVPILWNADPLNDKGIVVIVTYADYFGGNELLSKSGYTETKRVAFVTEDDGEHTFTKADLLGIDIPLPCTFEVSIVRGNYAILSSPVDGKEYSFSAYSVVAGNYSVQE